jgi:hypothetical protein
MEKAITLGDRVEDMVTGFQGIAVAKSLYLNGCVRYGVQGVELKDGTPTEWQWFDEAQLHLVESVAVQIHLDLNRTSDPGGPRKNPTQRTDAPK